MSFRRPLLVVLAVVLAAGFASADTKIVKKTHTDAFAIMGQQQPAKDEQSVSWIGDKRLRVDNGDASFIVRPDQNAMYLVNHAEKSYNVIDLPVDISKLLPPGMGDQMMQMMKFQVTVTPSAETRKVGSWNARRYDLTMNSAMMQMNSVVWTTKDVSFDLDSFNALAEEMVRMQPGMADTIGEMRKMEGFQVLTEATMMVMGSEVKSREETLSIDEMSAPAGTYEVPAGYTKQEFDFMKMQQMNK